MLRFSAIILSFVFLFINSGLHLDFHFCNDELTEISVNHDQEHCVKEVKDCCVNCDDFHLDTDNDNDQFVEVQNKVSKFNLALFVNTQFNIIEFNNEEQQKAKSLFYSNTSPPDKDLYKLNCQFCFYG